jgi:Kdo2-lipid IVA lauroyltransferase/acyltransferase
MQMLSQGLMRILLGAFGLLSKAPYRFVRAIGQSLGYIAYALAVRRRRIARTNLSLCLPQLSSTAREQIVRQHFAFYGRAFAERFIFWNAPANRVSALVRLVGIEHFEALRGKPVIVLAPHFLGLDAGGIRFQLETQFVSMYAKQSNPILDEFTVKGRNRFNNPVLLSKQDGLLPAVKLMRSGMPLYFLPDMDFGPRDAVFAPFFNIPAATVTSVARLAKLTGATIVPCVTRFEDHGYVCEFYPPWLDYPSNDPVAATTYMNQFIEQRVMESPAQYLWTHKRFKTRPNGEPSVYR